MRFTKPDPTLHPNVLLYGPPKTGKTAGACSAPGMVALLNLDLPNASWYAHLRDADQRIAEIEFEGFNTLVELAVDIKSGATTIDTLVVDTVGELHRRLLEEESNRAIRPTRDQYGNTATHVERFCREMCKLPVNVVFVCHDHPVKDESTETLERLPWTGTTNPALGQKLMGMVDIVGYTGVSVREDGEHEYVAQLIHQGGRRGGTRFGDVLGDWRPLDLAEWFEVITPKEVAA